MREFAISVALALVVGTAVADNSLLAALDETAGRWEGELYYLDYQSGDRFGIPMRVDAEMTPDRATWIRRITFTDPANLVHAVSLVTIDRDSGKLVEAYFRDRKAEHFRHTIAEFDHDTSDQWSVTYDHEGMDDGRAATIRYTLTRSGDSMTSVKQVRFADSGDDAFFLRNGTELRLVEEARHGDE